MTVQRFFLLTKYWRGEHFTAAALCYSSNADVNGKDNLPTADELKLIEEFCVECLDPVRRAWGKPLVVTSGFRDPEVNDLADGVATSLHLCQKGCAADIRPQGNDPDDNVRLWLCIADWGLKGTPVPLFDEVILYQGRVHVGWRRAGRMGELLERVNGKDRAVTVGEMRRRLKG